MRAYLSDSLKAAGTCERQLCTASSSSFAPSSRPLAVRIAEPNAAMAGPRFSAAVRKLNLVSGPAEAASRSCAFSSQRPVIAQVSSISPLTARASRVYSTGSAPPPPPLSRNRRAGLSAAAALVVLAGGAALYYTREEPAVLSHDRWTSVKVKSVTPLTPETSLFKVEVPGSLLPPVLESDPTARPILSLFVKEPNLQIQRAYTVRRCRPLADLSRDVQLRRPARTASLCVLVQSLRPSRARTRHQALR